MEKKTDDRQKEIESKAVFWDFHGTLAYPKHLWGESVFAAARIACAPLSPPFSPADVKEYTKAGWYPWDRYEEDFSRTTGEKWWEFMCGHFCRIYKSLGLSEDAANRASLLVRDELTKAERYELYPDAIPALRECRSLGWKNVLLSNHLPELPRILEALGCREYFSALVISSLAGYDKPRREIFEIAGKEAGNPALCVMVGDNPAADIAGVAEAGMCTILVHNSSRVCGRQPDFRAENLTEIGGILQKILSSAEKSLPSTDD